MKNAKVRDKAVFFFCICSRVAEAVPDKAIVLPGIGRSVDIQLREQDITWENFLSNVKNHSRYLLFSQF